jgi:hypothetical protein
MDAINLFSAGLRIIGLLSAGRGIVDLLYSALSALDLTSRSVTATFPFVEFVYGLFYLLMGLYLLRGAPWVVEFAFPVYTRSALDPDLDSVDEENVEGGDR